MLKEFKEFAMKGNVVDMAVGVVIGAAFGKIVTSLVGDIVMPLIGVITGNVDFSKMSYDLTNPLDGAVLASVAYGKTLTFLIDFTLIAFCLFIVIKFMNAAKRKQAEAPPAPEMMTKDQLLLVEIRDLLKQGK
jgi:large conductance mechanosensitive channel